MFKFERDFSKFSIIDKVILFISFVLWKLRFMLVVIWLMVDIWRFMFRSFFIIVFLEFLILFLGIIVIDILKEECYNKNG